MKRWAAFGLLATAVVFAPGGASVAAEEIERVGSLLSQDQYVAGVEGASFTVSVFVQGRSVLGNRAPTAIRVTSHRPVTSRQDVHDVIRGSLPSNIDTLDIPIDDADRNASGVIDLVIPIEIASSSPSRLQMSATGVHPLSIALVVGSDVTERLMTFIERLPEGLTTPDPVPRLPVSVVGFVPGSITLQPDGSTRVTPADRAILNNLVAASESLPGVPLSVGIRPELVVGLTRSSSIDDTVVLDSLRFADNLTYLSMPYVSIRPGVVAGSSFSTLFLDQLRLGDDALSDSLPGQGTRRIAWPSNGAVSADEAQFVRDVGFRSILLLPDAQRADGLEVLQFVDTTRRVDLELVNRGTIDALVADPRLSDIVTRAENAPASDAYLSAQHLLADLKMLRQEIADRGETIDGRSVILSSRDGSLLSARSTTAVVDTLVASGLVEMVDLDTALRRTAVGLADGRPVSISLPEAPDATSLEPYAVTALGIARVNAFASMLPDGDERPNEWRQLLDVATDDRMSSPRRQDYLDVIVTATDDLATAIVPPTSTSFTLGGRVSQIRLGLRNDGPTDLRVRLRLNSPKLIFTENEQVVTLLANTLTAVEIAVEARSNGRFPVTIQLVTPDGGVALTPPTVFTARVNALAGLGQVVTGVALLLLATWWVHHWRGQYRRRQNAVIASTTRHPSGDAPV